ncbi:MAG: MMPL family transporter, partial [Planctomycetes bacterium]|nr:MMPL family transporter [Planctomycetota bacterium]
MAIVTTVFLVPGVGLLETKGGFDTLVSSDSRVFKDTELLEGEFGGDPLLVMLKGTVEDIFSPEGLSVLERFEMTFGPDADPRVHSIIGPVTILKVAAEEAANIGYEIEWNDPLLVGSVVGDSSEAMLPEMAQLVPDAEHALTTVTFSGDIDYDTSVVLLENITAYFKIQDNLPLNTQAIVTGDLEMMEEIADAISSNMTMLLAMSVGVMAFILIVAFRVRWNLLALCMAGIATLWTFGVMGYLDVPLSMATMAVLPILIGLGIDYSIQFHKRYQEEAAKQTSVDEALTISTARMFPSVGIALLSTVI